MKMRPWLIAVTLPILLCTPIAGAAVVTTLPDPAGDTVGADVVQHDIVSLVVTLTGPPSPKLVFDLALVDPISPPSAFATDSLVGYLAIDTDQSATLSDLLSVDFTDRASLAAAGIDYYVDLFSELFNVGSVDLVRAAI